jgi:hypothetical protein
VQESSERPDLRYGQNRDLNAVASTGLLPLVTLMGKEAALVCLRLLQIEVEQLTNLPLAPASIDVSNLLN